jgi:ABC-type multidrug transport system ATPase subunit/ABC-type multidrug transport system permease subunit
VNGVLSKASRPYLARGSVTIDIPKEGLALGGSIPAGVSGIGDAPDADALITSDGLRHTIVGLSGWSGVEVNHQLLGEGEYRILLPGDTVTIGDEELTYRLPEGLLPSLLNPDESLPVARFSASGRDLLIGRLPGVDISLPHPTVSRRHAEVTRENGEVRIKDLGSANGTRVNGIAVRESRLSPGDEIAIGPFRIAFDGVGLHEAPLESGLSIEARGISLKFGDSQVLSELDLNIDPGSMVALIGASGAGKTTLMKVLSGILEPTEGVVLCGGELVGNRLPEIGYVPQFDLVHGELTVSEALNYAARLRLPPDTTAEERKERVDEVIQQLGLSERRDLRVDRLSGGQRKRVSVGIEILHRPRLIFLDEPTTGLDPGLERTMMNLFRDLSRAGQTVVLVTHATQSISSCDRVVVMGARGVKTFDGTPEGALDAFAVDSFDLIYERLTEGFFPADSGSARSEKHRRRRRSEASVDRAPKGSFPLQAVTLASRYALLVRRNPRNLASLAIQTVLLGLLTTVIFPGKVFEQDAVGKSMQLTFILVVIAIWIGCINSAREIVKERDLVGREMAVGVGPGSYLASKLAVQVPFVSLQILGFFGIVYALLDLGPHPGQVLAILLVSGLIAVLIGLFVSARSRSQDQATSLIPIMMVPQLLFGGALVTIAEMPDAGKALAALIPARWGYEAAGTALGFTDRLGEVARARAGASAGEKEAAAAANNANDYLSTGYGPDFFDLAIWDFAAIASLFVMGLFFVLFLTVRRFSSQ